MSMTRERAAEWFETHMPTGRVKPVQKQAYLMALSALRPVRREQVERIKGVWIFYDDLWEFRCSKCHKGIGNIEKYKFCPHCGAPMTDEAMQMVMERLEVLKDET